MTYPPLRLEPDSFLRRYWQKGPRLLRGVLRGFRDPVTFRDLAALAAREDVESRLVRERGGRRPWQVDHGPLAPRRWRRLPPTHWTLLVQGVDRHVPAVAALRDLFRFVPEWRLDDVMVSFARRFGGVGPHVDSYDVFLIQGQGRRRWSVDPGAPEDYRPGLDLRVLRRFRARRQWVLEPGDILYVPPGVGHHGVALEDCLTYSIGFRSPTAPELMAATLQSLVEGGRPPRRYRDADLAPARHPGEIARGAVERLRGLLKAAVDDVRGAELDTLVGRLLTDPKDVAPATEVRRVSVVALRRQLRPRRTLVRAPGSRLAFIRRRGKTELFVDGRLYSLAAELAFAGPLLSDARRLPYARLQPWLGRRGFVDLLARLLTAGAFRLEREA